MFRQVKRVAGRTIRRLLGIEPLLEHERRIEAELRRNREELRELRGAQVAQRQLLGKALSYLEFSNIDEKRMKSSDNYRRLHRFISLLSPMDIKGARYRRVGRDYDGGYVMLDHFPTGEIDAAYSFGIANDVSWDKSIAGLGIDVYMYDHTVDAPPEENPGFHFFKQGVAGTGAGIDMQTLGALIARNGHQDCQNLILKMDIEGDEWGVFDETPSDILNRFSQIVIEFHGLLVSGRRRRIEKILSVLEKINQTHQSVHVHANGFGEISWVGGLAMPNIIEVTYVRRSDHEGWFIPNTRTFPTKLDMPTFPWLPDVPLGTFSVAEHKD